MKFYELTISALDDAYIAWLSSAGFKLYMTGNFDSTDTTSGVLYQEAVTALLQDATSRGKVFQYVLERLEQGDPLNPDEILLRAQVWNQDGLIAVWKDALAQASSAPNSRDWMVAANGLSNAFKGMLDNPLKGQVSGYHGPKRLVDMYRGAARLLEQLSGPVTRMVGNEIGSMAAVGVGTLPARWQIGLLTALGQSSSPGTALIDLTGYTTPKRARKALAMTLAGRAGLNAAQQASAAAAESIASSSATIEGGRFKFGMVALADADQLKLFKALNAKAVIAGPARQAQLMGTLTVLDLHDAMRTTVSGPAPQFLRLWNCRAGADVSQSWRVEQADSQGSCGRTRIAASEHCGWSGRAGRRCGDRTGRNGIEAALAFADVGRADGAVDVQGQHQGRGAAGWRSVAEWWRWSDSWCALRMGGIQGHAAQHRVWNCHDFWWVGPHDLRCLDSIWRFSPRGNRAFHFRRDSDCHSGMAQA